MWKQRGTMRADGLHASLHRSERARFRFRHTRVVLALATASRPRTAPPKQKRATTTLVSPCSGAAIVFGIGARSIADHECCINGMPFHPTTLRVHVRSSRQNKPPTMPAVRHSEPTCNLNIQPPHHRARAGNPPIRRRRPQYANGAHPSPMQRGWRLGSASVAVAEHRFICRAASPQRTRLCGQG